MSNFTEGELRACGLYIIRPLNEEDYERICQFPEEKKAYILELVRRWNAFEEGGSHKDMDILLALLASGEARLEHSKTTDLIEFCWRGLRYACSDCDWAGLVKTIGYDKIEAALSKADKKY